MSGTRQGALKIRDRNLAKDPDFYKRIGSKGGKASGTGGFWHLKYVRGNSEAVKTLGAKGGAISRRGKSNITTPVEHWYDRFIRRIT